MDEDNKKIPDGTEGNDWIDQLLQEVKNENEGEASPKAPSQPLHPSAPPVQRAAPPQKELEPAPEEEEPPRRRRPKRIRVKRKGKLFSLLYLAVALAACSFAAVFCLNAVRDVLAISKPNQAITVTIPSGSDAKAVGNLLKEDGIIQYPFVFELVAKYENYVTFQAGTHVLNSNMDYMTLMKSMQKPKKSRETVRVTIPEGLPAAKIAKILEENGVCDASDFLSALENTDFRFSYESEIPDDSRIYRRLEGYLFPDTYEFYKNHNAKNALGKLIDAFADHIDEDAFASSKAKSMGYSMKDVVIIASLIEKETDGTDQRDIASVIYNHLQKPGETAGLLQIDASLLYGLPDHTGAITNADKAVDTPYNLYLHKGLPPTAIANPGSAALKAAMDPNDTDYYYYALGTDGKHHFSKTLSEHNAFVGSSSYGG